VELVDSTAQITWKDNVMWGLETGVAANPGIVLNEIRMKRAVATSMTREDVGVMWSLSLVAK